MLLNLNMKTRTDPVTDLEKKKNATKIWCMQWSYLQFNSKYTYISMITPNRILIEKVPDEIIA
jgi:hypothetical protein